MFYVGNAPKNIFFNKCTGNKYFIERDLVDEDNADSYINLLSKHILDGSTVLDVGCADGKFGHILSVKKHAVLYGIDVNPEAVCQAKNSEMYRDVYQFDLEDNNENSPEFKRFIENEISYDYIIMSDIFEHLKNPTEVLLKFSENLKYGGKILVSVPNIAHADIWLHLINGTFNYSDSGILDNTHLKFFTKESFSEWILDINQYFNHVCFDCEYTGGTTLSSELVNTIQYQEPLFYKFISEIPNYNVLQMFFILTKMQPANRTRKLEELLTIPKKDVTAALYESFKKAEACMFLEKEKAQMQVKLSEANDIINHLTLEIKTIIEEWNKTAAYAKEMEQEALQLKAENQSLKADLHSMAQALAAIRNTRAYKIYHKIFNRNRKKS